MRQLSSDVSMHLDAGEPVNLDEAEELVEDATPEGVTPDGGTQPGSMGGSSFAAGLVSDAEEADDPGIPATEQPQPSEAGPLDAHALATALSELEDENIPQASSHEQAHADIPQGSSRQPVLRLTQLLEEVACDLPPLPQQECLVAAGNDTRHYSGEAAKPTSLMPYGWQEPARGSQAAEQTSLAPYDWQDPARGMQAHAEQSALVHYHAAWNMHASEQQALQQQSMAQHATPGDWTTHLDPASGCVYYHNAKLGITQWETPGAEIAQLDGPEAGYKEAQVTCTCTVSQLRQAGACAFMGVLAISTAVACYFILGSIS